MTGIRPTKIGDPCLLWATSALPMGISNSCTVYLSAITLDHRCTQTSACSKTGNPSAIHIVSLMQCSCYHRDITRKLTPSVHLLYACEVLSKNPRKVVFSFPAAMPTLDIRGGCERSVGTFVNCLFRKNFKHVSQTKWLGKRGSQTRKPANLFWPLSPNSPGACCCNS